MGEAAPKFHQPYRHSKEQGLEAVEASYNVFATGEYTTPDSKFADVAIDSRNPDIIVMMALEHIGLVDDRETILGLLKRSARSARGESTENITDTGVVEQTADRVNRRADLYRHVTQAHAAYYETYYDGQSLDIDKLEDLYVETDEKYSHTPLLMVIDDLKRMSRQNGQGKINQHIADADRIARLLLSGFSSLHESQ